MEVIGENPGAASFTTRVKDTFFAPRRLPADLGEAVPWIDVLLISTAVAVLSVLAVPDEVFLDPMREAVTRRGEPVEITSAPEVVARWGRAMSMLGTLATHPIIAFVVAGAVTLVFSSLGRGRGNFREYLALTSHAMLIPAFGTILAVIARLVLSSVDSNSTMPSLTTENFPVSLPLSIDPFVVWMLIVIGIGVERFDRRRSATAASIVLIGGYLVFVTATALLLRRF